MEKNDKVSTPVNSQINWRIVSGIWYVLLGGVSILVVTIPSLPSLSKELSSGFPALIFLIPVYVISLVPLLAIVANGLMYFKNSKYATAVSFIFFVIQAFAVIGLIPLALFMEGSNNLYGILLFFVPVAINIFLYYKTTRYLKNSASPVIV